MLRGLWTRSQAKTRTRTWRDSEAQGESSLGRMVFLLFNVRCPRLDGSLLDSQQRRPAWAGLVHGCEGRSAQL